MRREFASSIISNFEQVENQVFITGDLGYMALEEVQAKFLDRFINAGVAEQNMVTVAASLAYEGFIPWVYSISPFVTLRPYEQIRNDVCLHNLPVKIVGNGGGYGYGIMGATHHNLEDIGALRILPNMKVLTPIIASDVDEAIRFMLLDHSPNYLRLNLSAVFEEQISSFSQWRRIKKGEGAIVIGCGSVIGNLTKLPKDVYDLLEIWALSIFPVTEIPEELLLKINSVKKVVTLEEHYGNGGLNEAIAPLLLQSLDYKIQYKTIFAKGYLSGKYGDQNWHQEENGLAGPNLLESIRSILM